MKDIYTPKLTAMFEAVESDFRAATVAEYRRQAEDQLTDWLERLKGPEPKRDTHYYVATSPPHYVAVKPPAMPHTWVNKQAAASGGLYYANYALAERDANASVDYAKSHFVAKQAKKLSNATKLHRGVPELEGTLHFKVLVTGELHVKYKNGDRFSVALDMIVNHRYTTGFKSFYQFPARFYGVILGGEAPKARLSEAWMAKNFK